MPVAAPPESPHTLVPLVPQPQGGYLLPPGGAERAAIMRAAKARKRKEMTTTQANVADQQPAGKISKEPHDPWIALRLTQVRARIESVSDALAALLAPRQACEVCGQSERCDPLDIERLSRALSSLSDVERRWAGRPDPGSLRPEAPTKRKGSGSLLGE